ncbi:AraC family transcriptional regulator, mar-sox-rob regulon activator/AraC family transcriptional regulator/AraC family of transcriptional regulator, multidrug resistance transcriptional activator [Candidatus Pantoea varia]|uniref:AraC family transcriptional regulator, mar-sox-rob regulon activator/AraC family transcriptional regulator/AraC family of transcriptional regulator, multidrug resistance transcriptional activator n=1 Tax=Candidatus Pantoea varia TaxID=1881036 RepID=A0A1I5EGN3_9GAMM|nr:helix-turn-helix domain-containing protein [Pantoea varia]SFO10627.1 AraC family transcriptional regulator, mar-sox-rob regulon activator/AraC family transcriptional regulator/AraC family of transcriptional regulator, multidrug resistance transcriptional activator [Pantoea varia]
MRRNKHVQKEVIVENIVCSERHSESPQQMADITSHSGYSRWHIQRLLIKFTSRTLKIYIRERKLLSAAKTLAKTDDTIINIGLCCGVGSQQTYTRHFDASYRQWRRDDAC